MIDTLELARDLIRFETINPPGNEAPCARFLGEILAKAGFAVEYHEMGDNRENLIARIGGANHGLPICFSGHVDVVPLGAAPWTVAPFAADVSDGKLFGRGSTDMKGGVAAFVAAAVKLAPQLVNTAGVVLVISAGEEIGLEGAYFMAAKGVLPEVGAMVIAEPTGNRVMAGHKGVAWIEGVSTGVTAHGSTPSMGINAVYKAAHAALALQTFDLSPYAHPILGTPTLNVGWLRGGMNVNSVPDEARLGIDFRSVPGVDVNEVIGRLSDKVGDNMRFTLLRSEKAVWTDPSEPFIQHAVATVEAVTNNRESVKGATYCTDAVALKPAMGNPPTIILGPGEPSIAHQTDEYCPVHMIADAEAIYTAIIIQWCRLQAQSA